MAKQKNPNGSMHWYAAKEGTFLHNYMEWCDPFESPRSYDFWCGLWVLSTLLGRNALVDRPGAPVHMNLYTVLCADAGLTRKSWSVNRAHAVLAAIGDPSLNIITGKLSPQAMLGDMAQRSVTYPNGTTAICSSELVTFLGRDGFNVGMPGLMTDLYDCPEQRKVMRSGWEAPLVAKNVYMTFLAASTPVWLVEAINPDVIEGGFTSRCLFIMEDTPKRLSAWPSNRPNEQCIALASEALDLVRRLFYTTNGRIALTEAALERFVSWYEGREVKTDDAFLASFFAREDHHILRLAGLLAVNENRFVIDAIHIKHAIRIITAHRDRAALMFGGNKHQLKLAGGIDTLRTVLQRAGHLGLSQSELLWKVKSKLNATDMSFVLQIMQELEMVQQFIEPSKSGGGRPKTIWRGTNKLMVRSLNALLEERLNNG